MGACLLLVMLMLSYGQAGKIRSLGLYEPTDNVTILTEANFYDNFLSKENAWAIELYNSWCGHCVRFAPTWKMFGSYAHGVLYLLAHYKQLGVRSIPQDVAKTSLPQTWHLPRQEKIKGMSVNQVKVCGYKAEGETRPVKSTLYNPIRSSFPSLPPLFASLSLDDPDISLLSSVPQPDELFPPLLKTNFGYFHKGSTLSHQQNLSANYMLNIVDAFYPDLPVSVEQVGDDKYSTVLTESQTTLLDSLSVRQEEAAEIEKATRLQAADRKWVRLRHHRVTASKVGEISKRKKGWQGVLSVGAIDCANADNINHCRKFNVNGYPTIMFFRPHQKKLGNNETHHKTDLELSGGQPLSTLLLSTHRFLDSIIRAPASWPNLHPLPSMQEVWKEAREQHQHLFLIFEKRESLLGVEVILDTMNLHNILVRRMLAENVTKFGISTFPSLYSIEKDGISQVKIGDSSGGDRAKFVGMILKLSGHQVSGDVSTNKTKQVQEKKKPGHSKHTPDSQQAQAQAQEGKQPQVYMMDLESALHYSFKQEVAIKNVMDQDALHALQTFLSVLARYLPDEMKIKSYVMRLSRWLQTVAAPFTGEQWTQHLLELQDGELFSDDLHWVGCEGSEVGYRGYPCGMWTLFHTLTVSSYLSEQNTDPKEVLLAIRGYMKNFFGCDECSHNFNKMASNLETEVHNKDDTVLWLWKAHNKANKRLHGDASEDPQHPKVQFPSAEWCSKCRGSRGSGGEPEWREVDVLEYLVQLYSDIKVEGVGRVASARAARPGELDWWEKKQRQQDLAKIRELRSRKQQHVVARADEESGGRLQMPPEYQGSSKLARRGWGLNGVDLGMCMMFYVMCAVIILLMYYHFTIRRNWKPCACLPI